MYPYVLVSNRGPDFKSGSNFHFAAGGTTEAYRELANHCCSKWLCLCSDHLYSSSVASDFGEKLEVLFVENERYKKYYYNFICEYLYPILLGFPSKAISDDKNYYDYCYVMNKMVETLKKFKNINFIFCDYHLYKLPSLIGWQSRKIFFWFLPFLSLEFHSPLHKEIIHSLSFCDVIYFLTDSYASNFKEAYQYYFPNNSLKSDIRVAILGQNKIFADTKYITKEDFQKLLVSKFGFKINASSSESIQYLLSVSRLDFVKNIPSIIKGFECYLKTCIKKLELHLLIIAPPHRQNSSIYQSEQIVISNLVTNSPYKDRIHLTYERLNIEELKIIYKYCDMFVVGSMFDGMPISALEYCLANKGNGCLITTKTAGIYSLLGDSIYTWNSDQKESLSQAINAIHNDSHNKYKMFEMKQIARKVTLDQWLNKVKDDLTIEPSQTNEP